MPQSLFLLLGYLLPIWKANYFPSQSILNNLSLRIERLNYRNDMNDTIMRRMNTDDEQFKNFKDYDIRVRNDDF